jgi:hypothetical protein
MRQDTELANCMRIPVQSIQNTHCRRYCSSSTNALEGTQNDEGTTTWDDNVII